MRKQTRDEIITVGQKALDERQAIINQQASEIERLRGIMAFALVWLDESKNPVAYGAIKSALKDGAK